MNSATLILVLSIGLAGSMGLILSPVLADIGADFGASVAKVAWAITAFGAGTAVSAMSFGYRLDAFGPARALQRAMLLAGAAQLGAALSQGWLMMSAAEFVVGLGAGVILPAVYALAAEISPKGQEARTLGRVILGWSLSLVFAVPLGAALAELVGWRVMLAAVAALAFLLAPFPRRIRNRRAAGSDPVHIGRFAPLLLPGGWAAYLVCFLFMASFYGVYAFAAPHAISGFGASTARAGLVALVYGVAFGGSSLLLSGIIDRLGRQTIRIIGFPLAGLVLAAMGQAGVFWLFLGFVAVWAVLNNLLVNTIIAGLTNLAPRSKGAVLGLYSGVTYMAAASGTALMGALFQGPGFWAVGLAAALMHGVILALIPASRQRQEA